VNRQCRVPFISLLMLRLVTVSLWLVLRLCASETDWQADAQRANASLEAVASAALASSDIRDKAWGAHLIAKHHLQALRPALLTELASPVDVDKRSAWLAQCGDALFATEGPLDPSVPVIFKQGGMGAWALGLVSREPDKHRDLLLAAFRNPEEKSTSWHAVANLLARNVPDGITALLETAMDAEPGGLQKKITSCRITVMVELRTPGQAEFGESMRGGGRRVLAVSRGCGQVRRLPGWPPLVQATLVENSECPGDVLVAPGPNPVFLCIERRNADVMGVGTSDASYNRNAYAVQLLTRQPGFVAKPTESLSLRCEAADARTFQGAIEEAMRPLAVAWGDFVVGVVKLGGLPPEVQEWRPSITLIVEDVRSDRSWNLPTFVVPGFPADVQVKMKDATPVEPKNGALREF